MPENLRITAPVTTTDGINKPTQTSQSPIVDAVNPAKVPQPNTRDENASGQSLDLLLSGNSVYSKFVQQLKQTPPLAQTLGKIVSETAARGKVSENTLIADTPVRQLAAAISMEKGDMLESLIFQQENGSKFSGNLFKLFRQISYQKDDAQFDLRLADFLKAFDGYFSAADTTQSILRNLETIEREIPSPYAKQLKALAEKIDTQSPRANVEQNLDVIKKEILPLLGKYVSQTNDYGMAREHISMLLHNTAILDTSSKADLAGKFKSLIAYCKYNLKLPPETLNMIQTFFSDELSKNQKIPENKFFDSLMSLISKGTKNGSDGFDRAVFQDACSSLLLDNSVYMPFTHIYLPVTWQGRFLFAQMWIEKEDENRRGSSGKDSGQKPQKVYLEFDIQNLGYFEASIALTGKRADISLGCPSVLKKKSGEISAEISRIFGANGFTPGKVRLTSSDEPQVPQKIMEEIYERKRIIDVTV